MRQSSDAGLPPWLSRGASSPEAAPSPKPIEADSRQIAEGVACLSMTDRAVIQPDLIKRLSAYASGQASAFGEWPSASWPFFDLVAQLDAEFGWHQQDRIVHLCLQRGDADRFMALLAWADGVVNAGPGDVTAPAAGGLPRVPAIDLYAFYDGGRDQPGLLAHDGRRYKALAAERLGHRSVLPLWSIRDGHYLKAAMGCSAGRA